MQQVDASADEDSECESPWVLGFVEEEPDACALLRHKFPSKVGGRPAWLDPKRLPSDRELKCESTGAPLDFLLQVYCPVDDNSLAFHRSIYLFVTQQAKHVTSRGAVRGYRWQLPRENEFYDLVPSKDRLPRRVQGRDAQQSADPWHVLAAEAAATEAGSPLPPCDRHVFPERRLVTDAERPPSSVPTTSRMSAKEAGGAVEEAVQSSDFTPDVEAAISSATTPEQKHFAEFAARISWDPDQVLRYCFDEGAEPLWPSPSPVPRAEDIPRCQLCGQPRRFEFEVLPQLINHLGVDDEREDSLDFGAIAVYSCSQSCQPPAGYAEEFVWVQR